MSRMDALSHLADHDAATVLRIAKMLNWFGFITVGAGEVIAGADPDDKELDVEAPWHKIDALWEDIGDQEIRDGLLAMASRALYSDEEDDDASRA